MDVINVFIYFSRVELYRKRVSLVITISRQLLDTLNRQLECLSNPQQLFQIISKHLTVIVLNHKARDLHRLVRQLQTRLLLTKRMLVRCTNIVFILLF